jgi:4-aminobutyrate aminotransferase
VVAIIVEPIQGEGGYLVPPPDFHRKLSRLARRHGILLIADEVQSGMGRTGKMFAIEHWSVEPDIIYLAKGIASGMPLGAIVAREEVMDWPPGSHASTFGGNPISCAAALETIELLDEELIENARDVGDYLIDRLQQLASRHSAIREVRGKGLMVAIELVDTETRGAARDQLVSDCFHRGLLLLGCGSQAIRFCPPLIISKQEVDTAVDIFAAALAK